MRSWAFVTLLGVTLSSGLAAAKPAKKPTDREKIQRDLILGSLTSGDKPISSVFSPGSTAVTDDELMKCDTAVMTSNDEDYLEALTHPCAPVLSAWLAESLSKVTHVAVPDRPVAILRAYGETWCAELVRPRMGCRNEKPEAYGKLSPARVLQTLKVLNAAVLDKTLGPKRSRRVVEHFDAKWDEWLAR